MNRKERGRYANRTCLDGKVVPFVKKTGETMFRVDYVDEFGKRCRRIVSDDETESWMVLAEILRERDEIIAGRKVREDCKLEEITEQYLDALSLRSKPSYSASLSRLIPQVLDRLDVLTVRDISVRKLNLYRKERHKAGKANATINREVTAVRAMLNWAAENELIATSPIVSFKRLPEGPAHQARPRRPMTDHEVKRFIKATVAIDADRAEFFAATKTIEGRTKGRIYEQKVRRRPVPQTPFWRAMLLTGGRLNELLSLSWGSIDFDNLLITFRDKNTKSGKSRGIPMAEEVVEDLKSLWILHCELRNREPWPHERVFLSPRGKEEPDNSNVAGRFHEILEWANIAKKIDGRAMTIHSLRHTFCTMLARAGVPLMDAQKLMGHSDPKLTAVIYCHVTAEDLRPSIAKLPRLGGTEVREILARYKTRRDAFSLLEIVKGHFGRAVA